MANSPIPNDVLHQRIAVLRAAVAKQAPAPVLETIAGDVDRLVRDGAGSKAPLVGDRAPDFTLPDAHGEPVSLAALLAEGPVVLAFYRGQWCPYCDLQLRACQEALSEIRALGAKLVAVSPQSPEETRATADKRALSFHVLSDAGNAVARRYGLAFGVSPQMDGVHKAFGLDLTKVNGDASNQLPIPGTFVIGEDGVVALAYVNPDFRERLEPAAIVHALEALSRR